MNARIIIFAICLFALSCAVKVDMGNATDAPITPGMKVIGLGTQLGHVVESKEVEVKKIANEQVIVLQNLQHWATDPDGELQTHVQEGKSLDQRCPSGTAFPHAQAVICNAAIDAYNVRDAQLVEEGKTKKAEADREVAEKQANIDRIKAEQAKLTGLLDSITACLSGEVMKAKACLDQLYDNASRITSAYDLDSSVVKPGVFGTSQITPAQAIDRYKASGDVNPQIKKIMHKQIVVPAPE